MSMITKLDFLAVPSQDGERSRAFYVDTVSYTHLTLPTNSRV